MIKENALKAGMSCISGVFCFIYGNYYFLDIRLITNLFDIVLQLKER